MEHKYSPLGGNNNEFSFNILLLFKIILPNISLKHIILVCPLNLLLAESPFFFISLVLSTISIYSEVHSHLTK